MYRFNVPEGMDREIKEIIAEYRLDTLAEAQVLQSVLERWTNWKVEIVNA